MRTLTSLFLLLCLTLTDHLGATGETIGEIRLMWTDNSDNEEGFRVERADNGGEFAVIATVGENVTEWLDETAEVGNVYRYRVNAFNEFGVSGYTNVSEFSAMPPSAPSDAEASHIPTVKITPLNDGKGSIKLTPIP